MKTIALVTDSTADIPQHLVEANSIHVVPTILIMDGKNIEDNGKTISRQEFYEKLPTMQELPTTAAPASGIFHRLYEDLFKQGYQQVLSIHLASALSGVFNAAYMGAQAFGERVHVMESGQASMGLGFQVLAAAEKIACGETLEAIISYVKDVRRRIRLIAMLDTLEYIHRSGRISWLKSTLGALLNMKLFIELKEGRVLRLGEARTRQKGLERLVSYIRSVGPLEKLALLHTNAEEDVRKILNMLNFPWPAETDNQSLQVVNITPIIGAHVGPQGIGFAAVAL